MVVQHCELVSVSIPNLSQALFEKADKVGKNAIIESVRTEGEVIALRNIGKPFTLLAVDANQRTRYDRAIGRGSSTDKISFEKFCEQERVEMSSKKAHEQNLGRCMAIADAKIMNDGTVEDLRAQVDKILAKTTAKVLRTQNATTIATAEASAKLSDKLSNFTNSSALMIAHERALETVRPDSLLRDPWARLLAGDKGPKLSEDFGKKCTLFGFPGWPEFHKQWTVVRTKFIDDHLVSLLGSGSGPRQFVNLGAGLDTRVLRLPCFRELDRAFEVDMQAVNEPKREILDALSAPKQCPQELVTANLTVEGSLTSGLAKAGFDSRKATVFLAEGLIMYLGAAANPFLRELSTLAAPSSTLILNFLEHDGFSKSELTALLEGAGWQGLQCNQYGDKVLNYKRFKAGFKPSRAFSFVVCTKQ